MNYHISPNWFCLKQIRESFPLPMNPLGGKKSTERPATIPSSVFACPHPSLKRTHTTTHGYGAKYFSMASNWHRKKYRRMLVTFWYKENWWMCPHQKDDMAKSETMFHWPRHLWDHLAPSAPSERPPCFLGCAWSHPTFHQRHPRTSKWTFTQNANHQTNQWMDWKTLENNKCIQMS